MSIFMDLQMTFPRKLSTTLIAIERFLTSMLHLVSLQVLKLVKHLTADIALVRAFTVAFHVRFQTIRIGVTASAQITFVRRFSLMSAKMTTMRRSIEEGLAADTAFVRWISCMSAVVFTHGDASCILFPTHVTFKEIT